VLADFGADGIKTGMLVSAGCVQAVADALEPYASVPLVVDTVMTPKGHGPARRCRDRRDEDAPSALAALITPTRRRQARVLPASMGDLDDLERAAIPLRQAGARAVLVKGGHLGGGTVTDVLVAEGRAPVLRTADRSTSTHGTGCTLASAIATGLAQGLPLQDAIVRARGFVREAIRNGLSFGRGTGQLNHLHGIIAQIDRPRSTRGMRTRYAHSLCAWRGSHFCQTNPIFLSLHASPAAH
jgi:hydroxymethylpyrimidine/phosphomethylpyrimidine kinase